VFSQAEVRGESSPALVAAGSFWTVSLLVDHPSPEDLEVRLPPLPRGLSLDQFRVEPRLVLEPPEARNQGAGRRWTALEYRFLAQNPGRIELGPFEVLIHGVSTLSPPFSATVRSLSAQPPRIFWRDLPRRLTVGEEAALVLCIEGWRRPDPAPEGLSLPPAPPMSILEVLEPQGEEELLSLRLIPLEGPLFSFPSFLYPLETLSLRVPALSIPVNPAPAEPAPAPPPPPGPESPGPEIPGSESPASEGPAPESSGRSGYPPFPDSPPPAGIWAASFREIRERSRSLWEAGRAVEALAELRRNERDHPAGLGLRRLRRDLEGALGLEAEPDENYAPRLLLIPVIALCLLLAALCLGLPLLRSGSRNPLKRLPTRLLRWGSLVLIAAALFCLLRLNKERPFSLRYREENPPRQALARDAPLYRVPDERGSETAPFGEGRSLLVYEIREDWAYAESPAEGRAGWMKTGTYLVY
jgi:hypothetical protein